MNRIAILTLGCCLAIAGFLPLLPNDNAAQNTPVDVSICDLATHPKSFDGKMIRVRGTLNVFFEDFTLTVTNCDTQQGIWLAFGGDVPGLVPSMVNDMFRKPGEDFQVNGVSYGINKDESFRRLYALISARRGDKPTYRATATLAGAFFAGEEHKLPSGLTRFDGYGHMGCCSLFVITEVSDVESVPPARLNVSGIVLGPDGKPMKEFVVLDDILGGSPPVRQRTLTSDKGKFEFSISGQLLRFENAMYRPLALPVEQRGAHIRLRLEDAKASDWLLPPCEQRVNSASQVGFSVLFTLPRTMEASPFNDDGLRSYFIFPHGSEPTSAELFISTGTDQKPEPTGAVESDRSEQRWIKDSAGTVIGMDSRGRQKKGGPWRTAIFWGHDSASYTLQSRRQTSSLDKIIDSACIAKP